MNVEKKTKIFNFAKVIGTLNSELASGYEAKIVSYQNNTSPPSSSDSSDSSSEGDRSPKTKQLNTWKGKVTVI